MAIATTHSPIRDTHARRAAVFNRFYIALMFVTICTIGTFGMYAVIAGQHGWMRASVGYDRANDARHMLLALDGEQFELFSQGSDASRAHRFYAAGRVFDQALRYLEVDPIPANDRAIVKSIRPQHDIYVNAGRAVASAIAHGRQLAAGRIEARVVIPQVALLRKTLGALGAEAFAAGLHEEAIDRTDTLRREIMIVGATLFAIMLLSGFAVLLSRYRRIAATASREKLAAFEEAALTDNLTQLGNHRAFSDDFTRELARAKRYDHALVLALIDVDDFKAVNDTRGHAHGDLVLTSLGDVLRTLRVQDRAYRVGGDEFALLLVETDPAAAHLVLARVQESARALLLGATLSIGYANLKSHSLDLEPYELADTALYEAKRRGRNNVVCFDDIGNSISVFSPRKAELVRRMIAEELVSIAFQPIWDIDSTRPLAFEALARPAPELGLSGPQEAFDIAERIRQVYELDSLCLKSVLKSIRNLPAGSTIFINFSPASLAHARFDPSAFVAQLCAAGVDPHNVVVELTERRIDDQTLIIQRALALQQLGVRIALDDTGSGHAGLEILSKLRLDFVKIDRELLVLAIDDKQARGVLAGIIAIARETGSYLIAEGIESRQLFDLACHAHEVGDTATPGIQGIQGYLLGRPELGVVDLRKLEQHHMYLEARSQEGAHPVAPHAA